MSPYRFRARFGAAVLASIAVLAACRDDSKQITGLSPSGAPSFVSAGSNSADWQQCANNGRTTTPCEWISSVLNAGKATYYEGENIPFRFAVHIVDMQGKTPVAPNRNTLRSVTFTYGFTKGTNGNYDFIGKFNQTEKQRANLCTADLSSVAGVFCDAQGKLTSTYDGQGSPLYEPVDAGIHEVIPIEKNKFLSSNTLPPNLKPALEAALTNYLAKGGKLEIDIFGGRAGSVDEIKYNVGGGDVTATVTVRFYANQKDVLLAFGAHFARLQDWDDVGYSGGAGQSGSPFHIKVDNIDGTTVGALGNNVAGAVVQREPAISIAKTVSATTVSAGDPFSWTVTLTNGGDGDATGAQIVDPLPSIAGYAYSTPTAGCSIATETLTLTCGPTTLAAGSKLTATVNASWVGPLDAATTCGAFPNTATGKATGLGDATSNTVTITVLCPNVTLSKSAASPTVPAGTPISFTVTVANTGQGAAKTVSVTDNLPTTPAGLSWSIVTPQTGWTLNGTTLSYSAASLAAGASSSITVTSPTTGTTCGQVNNTATATTTIGTVTGSPASASAFINCLGLTIVKRTNGANNSTAPGTFIKVGDPVAWTYEVKNTGNVALPNVAVTDDKLPASAISCPGSPSPANVIPSLAAGATVTCVASGTATAGQYGNVGTATSGTTTASDPDFYFGAAPSVAIIKKTNGSDNNQPTGPAVPVGNTVTWTYVVANAGNIALTNVTVTDDKVASTAISCPGATTPSNVIPTLAASATVTCTATGTATAGQYTNTGTAAASSVVGAPTPATDPDHYFGANPALSINKLTNGSDGPTITVGDPVTWTYLVKNTGNVTLSNIAVTDDKIANDATDISCRGSTTPKNEIASLAPGDTLTCTASGTAVAGAYTNTGTATSGTTTATDKSNYTGVTPTLTITKTPDGGTVEVGDQAEFTITVKNDALVGGGTANGVQMTDTLPAGLTWTEKVDDQKCTVGTVLVNAVNRNVINCNIGSLAPQASFSITVISNVIESGFIQLPPSATTSAIEIDGNLDPVLPNGRDWANLPSNVFSCGPTKKGCDIDVQTGRDDNSFGQGAKEDSPIPTVVTGSIPNNKSDLLRFYVASERVGSNGYLYLAWTRVQEPNGTTNMDFELNQSSAKHANGIPVRTPGDFLVRYDLSQGGTNPQLSYHKWVGSGPSSQCEAANSTPCWGTLQKLEGSNDVKASINTGPVTDVGGGTLSARTFGEASINLKNFFTAGVCTSIGQAYLKSRSSDAFGSEMKDFIAPIPVEITNCEPVDVKNTAFARATNFAPAGGSLNGWISDEGSIKVTQSTASLYVAPTGVRLAQAGSADVAAIGAAVTIGVVRPADVLATDGSRATWGAGDVQPGVTAQVSRGEYRGEHATSATISTDASVATVATVRSLGMTSSPRLISPSSRSVPTAHFAIVT